MNTSTTISFSAREAHKKNKWIWLVVAGIVACSLFTIHLALTGHSGRIVRTEVHASIISAILAVIMLAATLVQLLQWRRMSHCRIEMDADGISLHRCAYRIAGMKRTKEDEVHIAWSEVQRIALDSIYTTDGTRYGIRRDFADATQAWPTIKDFHASAQPQ